MGEVTNLLSSCPGSRVAARVERPGHALPGRPERHRGRELLQVLGRLWPLGACSDLLAFGR